jgi:hypothetical protein
VQFGVATISQKSGSDGDEEGFFDGDEEGFFDGDDVIITGGAV